jgi:hypothetical protein
MRPSLVYTFALAASLSACRECATPHIDISASTATAIAEALQKKHPDIWERDDGPIKRGEEFWVGVEDPESEEERMISLQFSPDGKILYLDGKLYDLYGKKKIYGVEFSLPATVFAMRKIEEDFVMRAGASLDIGLKTIRIGGEAIWDKEALAHICEEFGVYNKNTASVVLQTDTESKTFIITRGEDEGRQYFEVEMVD